MSKKFQLQIPTPCHEDWDHMSPAEKGRFCSSCQKQVVDFSNMSDREIAMFFKKPSTGSVCGRFMEDQLNRDIEIPRKRIPWVKYFFQFLLPGFLLTVKGKTQGEVKVKKDETKLKCASSAHIGYRRVGDKLIHSEVISTQFQTETLGLTISSFVEKKPMIVKGKIVDEQNLPIVSATINIPGTNFSKTVKQDGTFEINTTNFSELLIEARAPGYIERKIQITPDHSSALIILIPVTAIDLARPQTGLHQKPEPVVVGRLVVVGAIYPARRLKKHQRVTPLQTSSQPLVDDCSIQPMTDIKVQRISPVFGLSGGIVGGISVKGMKIKNLKPIEQPSVTAVNEPTAKVISSTEIRVYPNPARGGSVLHVEWKGNERGYHIFQFMNLQGQLISTREIFVDDEAKLLNIDIPSVPAGTYFLRITSKQTNRSYTGKILVQ